MFARIKPRQNHFSNRIIWRNDLTVRVDKQLDMVRTRRVFLCEFVADDAHGRIRRVERILVRLCAGRLHFSYG